MEKHKLVLMVGLLAATLHSGLPLPPQAQTTVLDYAEKEGRLATASYLVTRDGFFRTFGGTYQAGSDQETVSVLQPEEDDYAQGEPRRSFKLLVVLETMSCDPGTAKDIYLWVQNKQGVRQTFCSDLGGRRITISEGETQLTFGTSEAWGSGQTKGNLATLRVTAYYEPPALCTCRSCGDFCCKLCGSQGTGYCMSKALSDWQSGRLCPCGVHEVSFHTCKGGFRTGPPGVPPRRGDPSPNNYIWIGFGLVLLGFAGIAIFYWRQHSRGDARTSRHNPRQTDAPSPRTHGGQEAYELRVESPISGGGRLRARVQDHRVAL